MHKLSILACVAALFATSVSAETNTYKVGDSIHDGKWRGQITFNHCRPSIETVSFSYATEYSVRSITAREKDVFENPHYHETIIGFKVNEIDFETCTAVVTGQVRQND